MTGDHAFILFVGVLYGGALLFLLGYTLGLRHGKIDKPKKCQHTKGRFTKFEGMRELRDMFSGRTTLEEWKKSPDFKVVSRCLECDEVLP